MKSAIKVIDFLNENESQSNGNELAILYEYQTTAGQQNGYLDIKCKITASRKLELDKFRNFMLENAHDGEI